MTEEGIYWHLAGNGGMGEWGNGGMEEWGNGGMGEWDDYELLVIVAYGHGSFSHSLLSTSKL